MTMGQLRQTGLELQSRLDTASESNDALRARVKALEDAREGEFNRYLEWRGLDPATVKPCKDCSGSGVKAYGSTATWRGGAGGQMVTTAVCDKCWGSGDPENKWPSWRNRT